MLDGIIEFFSEFLSTIINALWYPFSLIIDIVIGVIDSTFSPFVSLLQSVLGLFDVFYSFMDKVFHFFPTSWTILIGLTFLIRFLLWVYSYVKDISIAGFKI